LNSSDKKKRKSKIVRGAETPRWNQTFGFEVTSIVRDKMEDGLKIICRDYNPIGTAGDL
jgi:Ca2+-dependent lipid-binding protein